MAETCNPSLLQIEFAAFLLNGVGATVNVSQIAAVSRHLVPSQPVSRSQSYPCYRRYGLSSA